MSNDPGKRVLEYSQEPPRVDPRRRRVLYCIGLPLIAFGLSNGFRDELSGLAAAAGALLVALVLPVRD